MSTEERKKINLLTLFDKKKKGETVVYITAYDYPLALLANRAGVDMILVGDSLGMTTLGYETTIPVTMDEMISHAKAVVRAAGKGAFIVGDMPFMSYQPSDETAIRNAGRFIQEAGCDAVKCEGGRRVASRVRAMVDAGIVVMGHLGLTPQNMAQFGGYRVQGKTKESFDALLEDALALEEAGAQMLLLEAMPAESAGMIRAHLKIPVYGIGAGDQMDGQLVIIHDILGLFEQFKPKFIRRYCEAGQLISLALRAYVEDVKTGAFPKPEHFYEIKPEEVEKIVRG
ncbi:MAG: 3-methyl-2-oxobutanoate hydroxymethyltransferase [Patescibacteria group bacterium]